MVSPPGAINGHLISDAGRKTRKEINGHDLEPEPDGVIHETRLSLARSPSPEAVDGEGDVDMGREETQEPEAPATFTLTTGHSVGVQITPAKAADLSPDTATLHVAPQGHVTRALWRPGDPTVFAAAGDDFCSIWKLSLSSPPTEEKIVENDSDHALISAVSWDPTGEKLAVATYRDTRGAVSIYNVQGYALDLMPETGRMITGVHWTPNDHRLLIIASDGKVSELMIWDDYADLVPPQVIDSPIYDFNWAGSSQAFACGNGTVYQCDIDGGIHVSRTFSSDSPDAEWAYIRSADMGNGSAVVAACPSPASIWVPTHDMQLDDAHRGAITSIELQPQNWGISPKSQKAVLASFGTDDVVKVWHIDLEEKRFDCIHRLFIGPSMPALAGGFSPDGYALAAASKDKLVIWNAERGNAMATWTQPGSEVKAEEPDGAVNGQNGEYLSDRTLSWDTDGKKIAAGFGKQVRLASSVKGED